MPVESSGLPVAASATVSGLLAQAVAHLGSPGTGSGPVPGWPEGSSSMLVAKLWVQYSKSNSGKHAQHLHVLQHMIKAEVILQAAAELTRW
jgi:hypothetical protein